MKRQGGGRIPQKTKNLVEVFYGWSLCGRGLKFQVLKTLDSKERSNVPQIFFDNLWSSHCNVTRQTVIELCSKPLRKELIILKGN